MKLWPANGKQGCVCDFLCFSKVRWSRDRKWIRMNKMLNHTSMHAPIESSKYLNDSILPSILSVTRQLDSEWGFRIITTIHSEPLPTGPVAATIFEFRGKLLDSNKMLVGIFVLCGTSVLCGYILGIYKPLYTGLGLRFHQFCYTGTPSDNDWAAPAAVNEVECLALFRICPAIAVTFWCIHSALAC